MYKFAYDKSLYWLLTKSSLTIIHSPFIMTIKERSKYSL